MEDVFAVELLQHLCLSRVYDVTEVHVRLHVAFEGNFHRLWDWHGCFTSGQCYRNSTGVSTERDTFRHTGVGVTTDDDRAIVNSNVVQYFVDYVGHCRVNTLRITCSDHAERVHERHQLRRVGLSFVVPYRGSVTARLERTINAWRDGRSSHCFQFLSRHRTSSVLRTYDVHFNANVRTSVQWSLRVNTNRVTVEDLLNSGQALAFVRDFFRGRVNRWCFNAQSFCSEGLQLLTEGDCIRTASFHELDFLWSESVRYVRQFVAVAVEQFLGLSVDGQNGTGLNRVHFFQYCIAVLVANNVAVFVFLLYPVFQVQTNTTGYADSSQEDRCDTVGTCNHWSDVDEWNVRA